jgi:hypothetical protein
MMNAGARLVALMALGVAGLTTVAADAATVEFYLDRQFSNNVLPGNPSPYLVATFKDVGANQVTLTLDTSNLLPGIGGNFQEFIGSFFFNSTPEPLTGVNVVEAVGQNTGMTWGYDPTPYPLPANNDGFKADGDPYGYDFRLAFVNKKIVYSTTPFIFTITGNGITANSFDVASYPWNDGTLAPYVAAHLQDAGNTGDSTWVSGGAPSVTPDTNSVPLPAPILAGALLLGGFGGTRALSKRRC